MDRTLHTAVLMLIALAMAAAYALITYYAQTSAAAASPAPPDAQHLPPVRARLSSALPVTAVLLNWKRPHNLEPIVKQLAATGWVHEVLVWNNNPTVTLNLSWAPIPLRVHNSPENVGDLAKYRACAMATHSVCYYQDDDWDAGACLEGLWRAFLAEPSHVHVVTEPVTAWQQWHWTFYDASLGLHTGHAWIGCGSFFLRAKAADFLERLERWRVPRQHTLMADCLFTLWQNQFPRILVQRQLVERPGGDEGVSYSGQPGFLERQYATQVYGIETLREMLAAPQGDDTLQTHWSYDASQGLTFISSVAPVNVRRHLDWPLERNRGTRENLPELREPYASHGPFMALLRGQDCWVSGGGSPGSHSFGYAFFPTTRRFTRLIVHTRIPFAQMSLLRLYVSRLGIKPNEWELAPPHRREHEDNLLVYLFDEMEMRAFLLVTPADFLGQLSACGVELE